MKIETKITASDTEQLLLAKGYAQMSPIGFLFDRLFTEEEKEENLREAKSLSTKEWERRCEEIGIHFSNQLIEIRDIIAGKYDIHQINDEKSTRSHYNSDWDLFYASNRANTHGNYISTFTLSLNSKRDNERNYQLAKELSEQISSLPYNNLCCYALYEAIADTENINAELERMESTKLNEPITYCGRKGHIRYLGKNSKQENLYGFRPYKCRRDRYLFHDTDIMAMILMGQIPNFSI